MSDDQAIDFLINHDKLYLNQVEEYLSQIGKPLEEYTQLPLEQAKQLTGFFVTKLDFGSHSDNSEQHMAEIYIDLAERIINSVCKVKYFLKDEEYADIAQTNQKTLSTCFRRYFYKCRFCGETFLTKYNQGELSFLDEEVQLMFLKYIPPSKTECYVSNETIQIKFKATSESMVFANDLRPFLKNQELDFDDNINTLYGRIKAVKNFAKHNVVCVSAGNCSMHLYQNKDELIMTNGCMPDIEEYGFSEAVKEASRQINATIKAGKYKLKKEISCSLWWLMGASVDDLDMEKLAAYEGDIFSMKVVKGAEYMVEFNSSPSEFKFYKLLKIND